MSETDPYMAVEYVPTTEEAKTETVVETVDAPQEPQEAPVTPEIVVPEGSVKKVLDWVSGDRTRAQAALDAETSGDQRSSLIAKLNAILN